MTTNVGIDDGFAATQVAVLEDGKFSLFSIPSRARSGLHGVSNVHGQADGLCTQYLADDNISFTVGDFINSETARFNEYPFSAMNRVIVNHALRVAGFGGQEVHIATGLPLSIYFSGSQPSEEVIVRKDESIRSKVIAIDDSPMPVIVGHSVYPESLAAWVDHVINDDGSENAAIGACVGIIDIGGRTTDIAVVMSGATVDHARSGSADIGVLDVVEYVTSKILHQFGLKEIPSGRVEMSLRTGEIVLWGKVHDIRPIIDAAVEVVTDRVKREIDRKLGSGVDIDTILLVGGGAHVFHRLVGMYPNVHIPDSPEFANARGFAKYMVI